MLPRRLRLSREDFEAHGLRRVASPHFSLSYGPASKTGGVAVVVSKKVAKLAVMRHLLKRRILSVLRPYADPAQVLIVHTRPGATTLPFPELESELISLVRSILPTRS